MSHLLRDYDLHITRIVVVLTFLVLIIPMTSCRKVEGAAAKDTAKTFASPEEAGAALLKAAKSGDQAVLLGIFGPDGKEVLFSGDAALDQAGGFPSFPRVVFGYSLS